MNNSIHGLVATALVSMAVAGCKPADNYANKDTATIQTKTSAETLTKASAESVSKPVAPSATPAIAETPQAKPKAQAPIRDAVVPKPAGAPPAQIDAAKAEAARTDSVRQAQEKADAMRSARLDSVRQAEAAKAVVKPEPAARAEPVAQAGADQAAQGKIPYEENCRKCHGVRGVPPKTMKEKFAKIATFDADFFAKHSDDSVVTVLTKGKNEDMKSFKDKLSRAEMVAVAAYIRSFAQK
jgi:mono/diheme cytochrome c family protein